MRLQLKIIALATAVVFDLSARAIDDSTPTQNYPALNQTEMQQFYMQMQQAVDNAERRVETAQKFATRHDVSPTWDSKLEFQQAITMLEVKKTLVNNFAGTESLRSAAVRNKLMNLLNSADITVADLAALQNLVLNEKERISQEDQQRQVQQNQQNVQAQPTQQNVQGQ